MLSFQRAKKPGFFSLFGFSWFSEFEFDFSSAALSVAVMLLLLGSVDVVLFSGCLPLSFSMAPLIVVGFVMEVVVVSGWLDIVWRW